jgi:hypothetical protein
MIEEDKVGSKDDTEKDESKESEEDEGEEEYIGSDSFGSSDEEDRTATKSTDPKR